jgi:hypothetical protein
MKAHSKQFVIGNQPKQVNEDWKTVPIKEALFLSHCPDLSIADAKDQNGEMWHLLGLAVQTDKEKKDPLTEISRASTAQVRDIYKSWAGRWMLIGAAEIHMDCCGLLGCFYTTINGTRWVSSSLAILQQIGGFTPRPETLKHRTGMEWYPLPFTRFEGIYQLLPSQVLNLNTFHIEARKLPGAIKGASYEEILAKLEEKVKHGLLNACRPDKRIFTQLTAGYDSRSVLATLHSLGIKAEAYTTESDHISHADATLPATLSKAAGYRHRYIKRGTFSKEKAALYDFHTAQNSADVDRIKFSEGQWDLFGKEDLVLRGSIFEAGTYRIYHYLGADFTTASMLKYAHLENCPDSFAIKAFSEWMNWVCQTPTEGLDWRDRFYLEQRVAGWLSAIEQSLDLAEPERFTIANCHDILSLMLSPSVEKREARAYYLDLIGNMCPALLRYPFNPPDPKFKKLQKRLIRISKMPLPELYKKLKQKLLK